MARLTCFQWLLIKQQLLTKHGSCAPSTQSVTAIGPSIASTISTSEIAAGAIAVEDKYDGIRVQLHVADGQVALYGRDANDITVAFPEIAAAAAQLSASLILDGEIVAFEEGHPLPVSAVQSRLSGAETTLHERERTAVQFIAFDLIAHNDQLLIGTPLHARHAQLSAIGIAEQCGGVIQVAPQRVVDGIEEIEAEFIAARMRGSEGIVLKSTTAAYAPGRRGSAWLKLKHPIDSVDCVVVGVEYGVGRRRTLLSELTFAVRDDLSGRLTSGLACQPGEGDGMVSPAVGANL